MRFTHSPKTNILTAFVALSTLLVPATAGAIAPGSVPYAGDQTQGASFPAFNIFNGVPSVGNEADFIRVKKDGEPNSALRNVVDTVCANGNRFDVWFYVHNGAKPSLNNNGSGPGVAHNVVARVSLPSGDRNTFPISGFVTASNAEAINDSATINCGGELFHLKYVAGSAQAFLDQPNKVVGLPDSLINGGAPIGTNLLDGNVWGCWEQRVWMNLKVEVERIKTPPPVTAQCDLFRVLATSDRKVKVTDFKYSQTNAAIKKVVIDWGDNSAKLTLTNTSSVFGQTHQYSADGTYNITALVTFSATGRADFTSGGAGTVCAQKVVFKHGKVVPPPVTPPETPPTTPPTTTPPSQLVNTGAGSTIGIFGATVALAAGAHRWFLSRRLSRQ